MVCGSRFGQHLGSCTPLLRLITRCFGFDADLLGQQLCGVAFRLCCLNLSDHRLLRGHFRSGHLDLFLSICSGKLFRILDPLLLFHDGTLDCDSFADHFLDVAAFGLDGLLFFDFGHAYQA